MPKQRKPGSVSREATKRRLEGSRKGAARVREVFSEVITRAEFAERVGVHPLTVKRWQKAKVVKPKLVKISNISTWVFTEADVDFGKRLLAAVNERPGELSLEAAALEVRRAT